MVGRVLEEVHAFPVASERISLRERKILLALRGSRPMAHVPEYGRVRAYKSILAPHNDVTVAIHADACIVARRSTTRKSQRTDQSNNNQQPNHVRAFLAFAPREARWMAFFNPRFGSPIAGVTFLASSRKRSTPVFPTWPSFSTPGWWLPALGARTGALLAVHERQFLGAACISKQQTRWPRFPAAALWPYSGVLMSRLRASITKRCRTAAFDRGARSPGSEYRNVST